MRYCVETFRAAGLQAKWTKSAQGRPIIVARERDNTPWFHVTATMWDAMTEEGVKEAFDRFTLLGNIFYVAA